MSINDELPDQLSGLLLRACNDGANLDREIYLPTYSSWHDGQGTHYGKPVCRVCLAGAVIAGTLKTPSGARFSFSSCDYDTIRHLTALDALREGKVEEAVKEMKIEMTKTQQTKVEELNEKWYDNLGYSDFWDWESFERELADMVQLALDLREIGL